MRVGGGGWCVCTYIYTIYIFALGVKFKLQRDYGQKALCIL